MTDSVSRSKMMRAWRLHEYGEPEKVLILENVEVPNPGPGCLLIKVGGIPLNLNDLERITGGNMMVRPELPYSPGMEACGIVVAAGEGAEHWIGRRVSGATEGGHGGYAEYVICPQSGCFDLDESIPLPDAAALFFPFHLAYLGLIERANLQHGETVLIHAAAGGSGSAAVQLAKTVGAHVIATAGSKEKLAYCAELGADHVINYKEENFFQKTLEITQGAGVDVVFDNVGSAVLEQSLQAIRYNGRYLMMGFSSDKAFADDRSIVPRRIALANISLHGVLLAYADAAMRTGLKSAMGWNFPAREVGEKIQSEIINMYKAGTIKAGVCSTIGFEDLPRWIARMGDGQTIGRVVAEI